jgi:putative membrane protein
MKRIAILAGVAWAALALAACHKSGSNAGQDVTNPTQSAPVNAAQDAAAGATGAVSGVVAPTSTEGYVKAAAIGDAYEVAAGKIAQNRAKSPEVKAFAAMMVKDHTSSTEAIKAAMKAGGLPDVPPPPLDDRRKGMIDNLNAAGDNDFDLAYLHQQLGAHIEALELHKGYASRGDNAALKEAAAKITPVVEKHLAEVRRIGGDKLKDAVPGG